MSSFHDGEKAVQARFDVRADAERVGRNIGNGIPQGLLPFLFPQRIAVAASLDARDRPWASLLTGAPGFIRAVGARELRLMTTPSVADPLASNLGARSEMGLLVIDLLARKRARFNGRGRLLPEAVALTTNEVYGNCPKYIQRRRVVSEEGRTAARSAIQSHRLDARAATLLSSADTFFLATFDPRGGADASHRGGRPGFVRVHDDRTIEFQDYPGNNMYNSLGNLAGHPRAGLLFVDFEHGHLAQITGRAEVVWEPATAVRITIDHVVWRPGALPLRFELIEPSPVNPPLPVTGPAAAASQGPRGGRRTR